MKKAVKILNPVLTLVQQTLKNSLVRTIVHESLNLSRLVIEGKMDAGLVVVKEELDPIIYQSFCSRGLDN